MVVLRDLETIMQLVYVQVLFYVSMPQVLKYAQIVL